MLVVGETCDFFFISEKKVKKKLNSKSKNLAKSKAPTNKINEKVSKDRLE